MRCGKQGSSSKQGILAKCAMRLTAAVLAGGMIAVVAIVPTAAQEIHRNGFEGRQTAWVRGEDNVRAEEKAHALSSEYAHQGTTSEFIQIVCPDGKNDTNFATYYYPTQPAPIVEDLVAGVWVKANRAGVQLQARLVLPRERNPKQLDEPMTVILSGDVYKLSRRWQKLELSNPLKLVKDKQNLLRAQLRREIDLTDAYIDRLILNLYTGAGQIDVYVDDLEVGPVKAVQPPPAAPSTKGNGTTTTTLPKSVPTRNDRGIEVLMKGDRLFVGGQPYFFRAIRYTDTPLKTLRDAGFNTVWFDPNVPGDRIEEAIGHGFWIVPRLPLVNEQVAEAKTTLTSRGGSALATARDVDALATAITKFLSGDSVLFWDLGGALQIEKEAALERTAKAVALADPNRPRGADVWDGFRAMSLSVDLVGTHRFPLMSSLELTGYRDWLMQRRRLTTRDALHWTWIQTHVPDWQMQLIYGKKGSEVVDEPIGPQPEQIRLLTYLGIAAGCRGLAFSSDRFLSDSTQGKDRWLMLAQLNQEIQMLEPILHGLNGDAPTWIETTHPFVKAAVLRGDKAILVLPVWLGGGAQYVPPQGSFGNLAMIVPLVPDGAQPWEISPARVQSLQFNSERKLGGTKITLPEFDLTSAIVLTSDLSPTGPVSKWQSHSRQVAPRAAQWARDLAALQLQKVQKTHAQLVNVAPPVLNADTLLREAEERLDAATRLERARDYGNAHLEAMRSMRPLRILMRAHWEQAIRTLDFAAASPYAVSFFTLPRHWELHRELSRTSAGSNALRDGDFESVIALPAFLEAVRTAEAARPLGKGRKSLGSGQGGPGNGQAASGNPMHLTKKDKNGNEMKHPGGRLDGEHLGGQTPNWSALKLKDLGALYLEPLPRWLTLQQETIDAVDLDAKVVPSVVGAVDKPEKKEPKKNRYDPSTGPIEPIVPPEPKLGEAILQLQIKPKAVLNAKQDKLLPAPAALERTYLAVSSPPVRFQPGTWVRISGWVRIPAAIESSADGFLLFDSVGDESLGFRTTTATGWRPIRMYRQVPASGHIWVTAALTGIGAVFIDDLKIEPLTKPTSNAIAAEPGR